MIAEHMVSSLATSAQLTSVVEADVSRLVALRDAHRDAFAAREGVNLTLLPFVARAVVQALAAHPSLNASLDADAGAAVFHDDVNLSIAVDTERGMLAPVVHGARDLTVAGLARRIADIAARSRAGSVTPADLSSGTFTLTNTGSRGVLFETPILTQGQVANLSLGQVTRRPVVVASESGDVIAVRSMMFLSLTYDHRLIDGADAARFLTAVAERLGSPDATDLGA
jgi:pyruvate dehydrogenase E2 component (dihydrolipoamide acetyltransferase)